MQSRKITMSLFVLLVFATTLSAAQIGRDSHSSSRTLGYYDSATGAFEPLHYTLDAELPALVQTTGTLTVKYTITVDATIPRNGVVGCSANATVSNDSSGSSPNEHGESIATLVSGKTYSCTVVIHYSWPLASASTDKIEVDGAASLVYGYQATATNGTATTVQVVTQRNAHQYFALISVPANGATTTITPSLTL
jgi:hypothetical protein